MTAELGTHTGTGGQRKIADLCRRQATWCHDLGSSFYEALLFRSADDYEQRGPSWDLLRSHESDPPGSALPLRLMGAVHRLVLEGHAPELAQFYASVGGVPDSKAAWQAFRSLLRTEGAEISRLLDNPVQTNDVGRSGTLLGGFLYIARVLQKPLRLLELGSSAGLNLCWDHFRYEWGNGASWGDSSSQMTLTNVFVNTPPRFPSSVVISERSGCDTRPIDVASKAGMMTLLSYTWADQKDRIARLLSACATANNVIFSLERASAGEWLEKHLAQNHPGVVTVVFNSIVWQYLTGQEQASVSRLIAEAGCRATYEAPLAWLQMEPNGKSGEGEPELRLQLFPGAREIGLAKSRYHAPSVCWLHHFLP